MICSGRVCPITYLNIRSFYVFSDLLPSCELVALAKFSPLLCYIYPGLGLELLQIMSYGGVLPIPTQM